MINLISLEREFCPYCRQEIPCRNVCFHQMKDLVFNFSKREDIIFFWDDFLRHELKLFFNYANKEYWNFNPDDIAQAFDPFPNLSDRVTDMEHWHCDYLLTQRARVPQFVIDTLRLIGNCKMSHD